MQITVPLSVKTLRETCEEAHGCKFVESAQKDTAHACKGKRTDLGEKEFPFRFEAKQTWPLFQKRLEWADRNPEKVVFLFHKLQLSMLFVESPNYPIYWVPQHLHTSYCGEVKS